MPSALWFVLVQCAAHTALVAIDNESGLSPRVEKSNIKKWQPRY